MHPVTLFYAVLCALALACAWHAGRDRRDAMLAGIALTIGCLLSNIAWFTATIGNWKRIDAAVMLFVLWILMRGRRPWKVALASLAVATMGVHALVEQLDDRSEGMMYAYPAALNAIFVLQLLCVASNGFRGARDHGSDWLVSLGLWGPRRNSGDRGGRPHQ